MNWPAIGFFFFPFLFLTWKSLAPGCITLSWIFVSSFFFSFVFVELRRHWIFFCSVAVHGSAREARLPLAQSPGSPGEEKVNKIQCRTHRQLICVLDDFISLLNEPIRALGLFRLDCSGIPRWTWALRKHSHNWTRQVCRVIDVCILRSFNRGANVLIQQTTL